MCAPWIREGITLEAAPIGEAVARAARRRRPPRAGSTGAAARRRMPEAGTTDVLARSSMARTAAPTGPGTIRGRGRPPELLPDALAEVAAARSDEQEDHPAHVHRAQVRADLLDAVRLCPHRGRARHHDRQP